MIETASVTKNIPEALAQGNSIVDAVNAWPVDKIFVDIGLTEYQTALDIQMAFHERVHARQEKGFIILCRHPAIITLGRKAQESDITTWSGSRLEVSRGGKVTYHGPSQLVVYPIINLNLASSQRPAKDIHAYIRLLEQTVVETLREFSLEAHGKSGEHDTGIWVGDKKIASIGIAIRHWITYHGAAINIEKDPTAFQGIKPCGMESSVMGSIEEVSGKNISRDAFQLSLRDKLVCLIKN